MVPRPSRPLTPGKTGSPAGVTAFPRGQARGPRPALLQGGLEWFQPGPITRTTRVRFPPLHPDLPGARARRYTRDRDRNRRLLQRRGGSPPVPVTVSGRLPGDTGFGAGLTTNRSRGQPPRIRGEGRGQGSLRGGSLRYGPRSHLTPSEPARRPYWYWPTGSQGIFRRRPAGERKLTKAEKKAAKRARRGAE